MKKNLAMEPIKSSFLSCEKDTETILRRLFIESQPHNQELIRLLKIPQADCLTNRTSALYNQIATTTTLKELKEKQYIRTNPRVVFSEHEEIKSYIGITMDNFEPNMTNPQFRDCTIIFDIVCNSEAWDLNDYQIRPLKIAGYIDGILNNSKLSGIGTLYFIGCHQFAVDENLIGYNLMYQAIHGGEDTHEGDVLNG
jgi:hypothetical protein